MQTSKAVTEFGTRDLQIGVALIVAKQPLVRLEWEQGRAFFIFPNKQHCDELVEQYWSGNLQASAKDYFNALRGLKDRLFQAERDGRMNHKLR